MTLEEALAIVAADANGEEHEGKMKEAVTTIIGTGLRALVSISTSLDVLAYAPATGNSPKPN